MSTTATSVPATTTTQPSEASKIVGLLYTLGVAAAAIFVKNPNHQATAGAIVTTLNALLPEIQSII